MKKKRKEIKSIRISDKDIHKKLLKVIGLMMEDSGKFTTAEEAIDEMIYCFSKVWRVKIT